MDRRRPLLVNDGEFRTDEALREACDALGYRVTPKVRVADALLIDRSGLTDEEYGYALKAHFDWVVVNSETSRPEFAIEFDGSSHAEDRVRHRDAIKDRICARLGMPLLRIDHTAFRPIVQRTVIYYLVESWSLMLGFLAGQDEGSIPEDEVWTPWGFIEEIDEVTGAIQLRDLAAPARQFIAREARNGVLTHEAPYHCYKSRRLDDPDHTEAFAWVYTTTGKMIVGHVRLRTYTFPAVLDFDLADDLAHLALGDKVMRLSEGDVSVLEEPTHVHLPERFPGSGWSGGGPARPEDFGFPG